ncbi:hypothetical protein [Ktedonospora formicarum]|uniref:HTH cro/C1-type domain-containing protein n=1 Tax=Ktedonospora formicarum TaxID=2778364 RepID=A0A8J3I7K8_9CHLR|nr:hypothetical protein [Ktedonospora formicarum]GHO48578.1 hypothetical protein KSX_67410 [Ktedonospora formicarum]
MEEQQRQRNELPPPGTFPNHLDQRIRHLGFQKARLAKELDVSPTTFSLYVTGRRAVPHDLRTPHTGALTCSVDELFPPYAQETPSQVGLQEKLHTQRQHHPRIAHQQALLPVHVFSVDIISTTGVLWFALKQKQWKMLVESYSGDVASCSTLQSQLDQEYMYSRRQSLVSIAALPILFIARLGKGAETPSYGAEDLLPYCAASVTACWHLMRGSDFAIVEEIIAKYVPALEYLAQHPSAYQTEAARLATQVFRLRGILALHRDDQHARETYFRQAVLYGKMLHAPDLRTAALISLAYHQSNPNHAGNVYEQALPLDHTQVPLLQSRLYAELAVVSAKKKQHQLALEYLRRSQDLYPEQQERDPSFLCAEFSPSSLIMENGRTYLALHEYFPDAGYDHQAMQTFQRLSATPEECVIPERIRMEVINYQAKADLYEKKLDMACEFLAKGIEGAQQLGSKKRRREAWETYQAMKQRYPDEKRLEQIADLFVATSH